MATEGLSRRRFLSAGASLALLSPALTCAAAPGQALFAAWQHAGEQHIGVLRGERERLAAGPSLTVPTRAHGLLPERGGAVLAVARRPGDWLLRWHPHTGQTQWMWLTDDRRFNGHGVASADGARLWTTETDLDTAQGLLGLRHAGSLEKCAEWPTGGPDPHQVLALPEALGGCPAGSLLVANGGLATRPETGRLKQGLDRMDASLVALHPGTGERLGQWRLADPWLSIRHLAWDPHSRCLGVALQAEHPDPTSRAAAPVLAVWDGQALRPGSEQPALAGYGGDICALPGGGFAVSCPRAGGVAAFTASGRFMRWWPQPQACALASDGQQWWSAGETAAHASAGGAPQALASAGAALRFDNHWQLAAPGPPDAAVLNAPARPACPASAVWPRPRPPAG